MASSTTSSSITTSCSVIATRFPAFAYRLNPSAAQYASDFPQYALQLDCRTVSAPTPGLAKRACQNPTDVDCGNGLCCSEGGRCISDGSGGSLCVPNYSLSTPGTSRPRATISTAFADTPNSIDATAGTNGVYTSSGTQTAPTNSYFTSLYHDPSTFGTTYTTVTVTTGPSGTAAASNHHHGLSGGAIAGIVIGVLFGLLILPCLIVCCCLQHRRNKKKKNEERARGLKGMGLHDGAFDGQLSLSRRGSVEVLWPEPRSIDDDRLRDTGHADVDSQPKPRERLARGRETDA
ncbi:MAG: hypothetical protein Q9162_001245 [Coniocarpon cinnabarinum]